MSRKRTTLASVRYHDGTYKLYVADLLMAVEGKPCHAYPTNTNHWTYPMLYKAARKINKTAKDKTMKNLQVQIDTSKYVSPNFEIASREG